MKLDLLYIQEVKYYLGYSMVILFPTLLYEIPPIKLGLSIVTKYY